MKKKDEKTHVVIKSEREPNFVKYLTEVPVPKEIAERMVRSTMRWIAKGYYADLAN